MLNEKMLSTRAAGHVVQEIGHRLDANSCGWEQCKKYTLWVKDWVWQMVEECKLPQSSLHRIQIRIVPSMSVALSSILLKIPGKLGGWPRAPQGQEEKPPSLQVHNLPLSG